MKLLKNICDTFSKGEMKEKNFEHFYSLVKTS